MKKTISVNVRLTKQLDAAVKRYAEKNGNLTKGAAMRQLLLIALKK